MGGLCAGCQAQFQVSARISDTVPGLTELTNTVQIAAALPDILDPYPANNRTSWSGTVIPTYGVGLEPATSEASGRPGTTVTHTLRLTNSGNAPATFDLGHGSAVWDVVSTLDAGRAGARRRSRRAGTCDYPATIWPGAASRHRDDHVHRARRPRQASRSRLDHARRNRSNLRAAGVAAVTRCLSRVSVDWMAVPFSHTWTAGKSRELCVTCS